MMYDPKKMEMKKQILTSLKTEGRARHATRLKDRFAPPPPLAEPGVDASDVPVAAPGAGTDSELTKEKIAELLAMLK